ncbi:MAG: hypothetical protein DMG91_08680 [Acidobacteria bacterium]|jgi:uncharacterized protein|nr:MAG: hypothetical protein DMG91_08680 [Acidobacteriota bacterium]
MTAKVKRFLLILTGWAFVALGIVGLFLPVLQGILFLLIGLVILSAEYTWAQRLLQKLRDRFPKIGAVADQASAKATAWMHRVFGPEKGLGPE